VGQLESPSGTELSPCLRVANLQKILFLHAEAQCSPFSTISRSSKTEWPKGEQPPKRIHRASKAQKNTRHIAQLAFAFASEHGLQCSMYELCLSMPIPTYSFSLCVGEFRSSPALKRCVCPELIDEETH
jgi:hypothetical protein